MDILSFKPGHDGHIAYIRDGKLDFSIESEKDSGPRYAAISPSLYVKAAKYLAKVPDVVAIGGWASGIPSTTSRMVETGYFGESNTAITSSKQKFMGKEVNFFSSSHERSHLLCSYGLSPFEQGQPCYALVWEGIFGAFYKIDEKLNISKVGEPLEGPGTKYQFLYSLADPSFSDDGFSRMEDAGKLMALASYGTPIAADQQEADLIEDIFSRKEIFITTKKRDLRNSPYYNIGVESQKFKQMAKVFSDGLYNRFFEFAERNLHEGFPLLISGGCGLNCDWNSAWKKCGLFSDVFVPPCTNDSGSAIGTAIDALHYYTGRAKIDWDAYAGEDFVMDDADTSGIRTTLLNMDEVATFLSKGNVLAWVQGRYEIGPRALGNRSIIAMPFSKEIHKRLNKIKEREGFRPIAPICLEEDIGLYFDHHGPSPHMLYFQKVLTDKLPAITHVDGSARLQSVNRKQNQVMHELLSAFKRVTGTGVLCNTSLNFKGTGFINRMSDLIRYCKDRSMDGFVVNDKFYTFV